MAIVFCGETNGSLLGNAETFCVGFCSWKCSIPIASTHGIRFQPIPSSDIGRTYAAIACNNNIVYILGGQNNTMFLSLCQKYDPFLNSWSSICDFPLPIHGCAAAFVNDVLYVTGGKTSSKCENRCWMYCSISNSWTERQNLCEARSHFSAVTFNGCIYAVGGIGYDSKIGKSKVFGHCEKYDPEANSWIPIAPLCHPRAYHGVVNLNNSIYAVGGFEGKIWLNSVEKYDYLSDSWKIVSPMISPRSSFGITVIGRHIYCIGGFNGDMVLNCAEKYTSSTDMWHSVPCMQFRRYACMASTVLVPAWDVRGGV